MNSWDREASPNTRTPVRYVSDHEKMQRVLNVVNSWRYRPVGAPANDTEAVRQIREIVKD